MSLLAGTPAELGLDVSQAPGAQSETSRALGILSVLSQAARWRNLERECTPQFLEACENCVTPEHFSLARTAI